MERRVTELIGVLHKIVDRLTGWSGSTPRVDHKHRPTPISFAAFICTAMQLTVSWRQPFKPACRSSRSAGTRFALCEYSAIRRHSPSHLLSGYDRERSEPLRVFHSYGFRDGRGAHPGSSERSLIGLRIAIYF